VTALPQVGSPADLLIVSFDNHFLAIAMPAIICRNI